MSELFYADAESPIVLLSAKKHFDLLSTPELRKYAHYLSRASFNGSKAVLRSVSPESEYIFELILAIHEALGQPSSNEEYFAKLSFLTDKETLQYLEYASQFLGNLGNYKSFGDRKFIPRLSQDKFETLVKQLDNEAIYDLFQKLKFAIYSTDKALLGYKEKGLETNYYPCDEITKADIDSVDKVLTCLGVMPENTRIVKNKHGFTVLVASASNNDVYNLGDLKTEAGVPIRFQFGDHSQEFKKIVDDLQNASKYVANETQSKLVEYYIEAFETGNMKAHKKSQIEWVKDLKPEVESNIGFIETYRDPAGVRGEWEGLVAMVNHERTAKFSKLVENAGEFIPQLPWDSLYEKDQFTPPDFTSLEVLTFAGSGIPAGINIPNYDDVRLNYGFKNVSLGNVLSANPKNPKKEEIITFIDEQDLFKRWRDDAFEVQVGLHELLGHGTGKLLQEVEPGKFNFDKSDKRVKSWYAPNQTWGGLFGAIAGAYEECRAELVALYLILKNPKDILPIFEITTPDSQREVAFIASLLMIRAGLLGLEFWDPEAKKWGQPHMQARFAIMKQLHQAGVFQFTHSQPDFSDLKIDIFEEKIFDGIAVDALGDFLGHLHVFKCTGNRDEGVEYFLKKSNVGDEYAKFRDIVLKEKRPRKQLIQGNTILKQDGTVDLVEYDESETGMIQSYYDRNIR
ncbi:YOL057W [Candida oxycetoniae]|uniref:Dipeptidyl peptidase 3 n=1 Tax=Candida oxycetoniae TaxID=497107 RepID=A0AAI9WYM0_9ASCO|nr:YOL057W [Candida oxycetoniae]KAI3404970.2 YOL057W [Candida oxycetoniae]